MVSNSRRKKIIEQAARKYAKITSKLSTNSSESKTSNPSNEATTSGSTEQSKEPNEQKASSNQLSPPKCDGSQSKSEGSSPRSSSPNPHSHGHGLFHGGLAHGLMHGHGLLHAHNPFSHHGHGHHHGHGNEFGNGHSHHHGHFGHHGFGGHFFGHHHGHGHYQADVTNAISLHPPNHPKISGDTPMTTAMLRRLPSRVSQTGDLAALFEDDDDQESERPIFSADSPDPALDERRASIGIVDYEIKNGRMRQNARSSLIASLILLYGLSMILCSAVLPISDAFADDRSTKLVEHSVSLSIFHLSQYAISIFSLIYLMIIIKYYTRRKEQLLGLSPKKSKTLRKATSCCRKAQTDSDTDDDLAAENNSEEKADRNTLSDNAMSANNVVNLDSQVHFIPCGASTISAHSDLEKEANQTQLSVETNTTLVGEISQMSEGVNLYLRLGAVGFGFGVMVHDGFKISDQWQFTGDTCSRSILWIPEVLAHFVYVFIQTYFLLKYHRIVFNCQKPCVRFCLTHLAVTNVGQWLKTVVFEITEDLRLNVLKNTPHSHEEHVHIYPTNSTLHHPTPIAHLLNTTTYHHPIGNHSHASYHGNATHHHAHDHNVYFHNPCHGGFSETMSPYLFPCAIEYSLISAAIFFKIFQKVGHMFREGRKYRTTRMHEPEGPLSGCHRSHRGLFIGLLVFMATLVSIALFFVFSSKFNQEKHANYIYQATEITLLFSTAVACFAALLQFRKLDFHELSEGEAFDDNLLLIGLAGVMGYSLFLLLPSVETVDTQGLPALLFLMKSAFEIVQSLIQVLFIVEASRRRARKVEQFLKKPGRSLVTFLIVINLAMWVVNTFEVKRAESHPIHINYYSELPWSVISRIFLPLIIFFRFHSTVCLSDIWTGAYKYYKP